MFDEEGTRFLPHETKSKSGCCVQNCSSRASIDITVRFHGFPKSGMGFVNITDEFGTRVKICRRDAWIRRLALEKKKITENTRVCSLHFRRSDYILPDAPSQKKFLKRDAVPSCNLPTTAKSINISPVARIKNKKTRQRKELVERSKSQDDCHSDEMKHELLEDEFKPEALELRYIVQRDHCYTIPRCMEQREVNDEFAIKEEPEETQIKLEPPDINDDDTHDYDCSDERMNLENLAIKEESERTEIKFETVDLPDINLNDHFHQIWGPSSTTTSTTQLLTTTKTKTNATQATIVCHDQSTQTENDRVETKFMDILKTDRALNIITGIPNHDILRKIIDIVKKSKPRYANVTGLGITIADRVIMTFTKLKQGLSYGVLAIFFKCESKDTCKRIILKTLDVLNDCLKFVINWRCRNEKIFRIPDDFTKFPNIRCIINRIEIAVRKTKDSSSRRQTTRSCYKRGHSVKFVTAARPDGTICFLSKACDGKSSHRDIFADSCVIELLRKNDVIMILKDFPIDDICRSNSVKLVRSLLTRNNENLTNPTNYRVRLNVNRRIRRFRIFRRKLTSSLCLRAEKIVTIICAIENLHKSTVCKTGTRVS